MDPQFGQNVGLHLRSKLFDIQIIYQQRNGWKQWIFWKFWKKPIFEKNYPACKELKQTWRSVILITNEKLYRRYALIINFNSCCSTLMQNFHKCQYSFCILKAIYVCVVCCFKAITFTLYIFQSALKQTSIWNFRSLVSGFIITKTVWVIKLSFPSISCQSSWLELN